MESQVFNDLGPLGGGKGVGNLAGGVVNFFDIEVYNYTRILILLEELFGLPRPFEREDVTGFKQA